MRAIERVLDGWNVTRVGLFERAVLILLVLCLVVLVCLAALRYVNEER